MSDKLTITRHSTPRGLQAGDAKGQLGTPADKRPPEWGRWHPRMALGGADAMRGALPDKLRSSVDQQRIALQHPRAGT